MDAGEAKQIAGIVKWAEGQDDAKSLSDADKVRQKYESIPRYLGSPNLRKMLAVGLLAESIDWTITRCIAAACISRATWYNWAKKPAYREAQIELARLEFGRDALPVAIAFLDRAREGDVKAQDRILTQLGILDPPQRGDVVVPVSVNVGISIAEAPESDRQKFREDCVAAWHRTRPSSN